MPSINDQIARIEKAFEELCERQDLSPELRTLADMVSLVHSRQAAQAKEQKDLQETVVHALQKVNRRGSFQRQPQL